MTIERAKQLKVGWKLIHNGVWAARIGNAETFEVLSTDHECIRVRNERGYISRYNWDGCSKFVTEDFFRSCRRDL